jgi:Ca2+-binding RTX toxin-like protein
MAAGTPGARNVLMLSGPGAFSPHIFGIEVITASAAVDIINLTWREGGADFAYDQNVTVQSGDGNDVVFSGDGDDLLIADDTGSASFSDTLFGGRGNDVIFADAQAGGPGGADTVFGGFGNDTAYGGAGNDQIVDFFDGNAYGGLGGDLIAIHFSGGGSGGGIIDGGPDDTSAGTDGNDRIFVTGVYDEVISNLGPGDDLFVSFADETSEVGTGERKDIVYGGGGSDVISTWYGDDTIDGGSETDALWGGDGGDTIYGGPGTDFLYPGEGDNDQVFGGTGVDYYYWSRFDGQGDQIFDEFRGTGTAGQAVNGLIVFPGFDENGIMNADEGVFEVDGLINEYQPGDEIPSDDMVYVYDLDGTDPGTLWRLEIVDENSASYGNYVDFDQRDISVIALWNHEAGPGEQVITQYVWNGTTYALAT